MIPLHKLERIILEYLNKHDNRDLNEIAKNTNILIDQARRAGEWLKSRNLIEIQKTEDIKIYIESNNGQIDAIYRGIDKIIGINNKVKDLY